ncbi:CRISPR-associated helicase, Cas3 family [Marinactinospora thermotolerans DSM 45154]|uniref:CRISPR-associated helicase, Cas3 family n=1 Tax=Marinactinospora thermotolerans DSM 45154 TaxID=1122192 RepID=A0A1T4QF67_9ACTN|nr:CRISPR-associated helicase/endonuclease Cas3 [Marinactinospora thermotolerans]SKA02443.1 CRISPR-associated helicase, Cas3 family [Marinactinospora thermotolerans DSM 45154]
MTYDGLRPIGPVGLSEAARSVWAKHDRDSDGWLPLWRHMADSAGVAGLLWDEWVPEQIRRLVAGALPGGADDARRLAVWLAATHDAGKATPAFACQVEHLADGMRAAGLPMPLEKQIADRRLAPHGLAGQLLIQRWLVERHGWSRPATTQFAVVAGGHHGVPPEDTDIRDLREHPALLCDPDGPEAWRAVQDELLDAAAEACGVASRLADWRGVKLPQPVQVLLTALVIIADWIASNPELFPYFPGERRTDPERLDTAWRMLDLPRPWVAEDTGEDPGALFASRFDLPAGARVHPVQAEAVRVARTMPRPGLMIVEAPMGEGKTEAALAAAEILAARSGAGGCFVALPTMATGNAMFPRLLAWLERLPDARAGAGAHSVFLAHSKAALNERFTELVRAGRPVSDVDRDGEEHRRSRGAAGSAAAELVAHHWLKGRKKGMLSSFAVGTIDQLLFAGLKSRHLALRHLAVAGKVVVVDEAHAYDAYMNSYLDRVLSWLGAYGVPVVVLSATLPAARRRELAESYTGGPAGPAFAPVGEADAYPLITGVAADGVVMAAPEASGRRTDVLVERFDDDLGALAARLETELAGGGCALVIRNTVRRVMETADHLREHFGADGIPVTVAHARFIDPDRAENDARLLALFGPEAKVAEAGETRPERHVVVASQVAEQSLDVDFDLLVTDLAPVDLLLQRMGRLHRHRRGEGRSQRPERLRRARCLVTGADWAARVPEPVRGSRAVYGAHALLRSAAVLEPFLAESDRPVRLPDDISPLVQRAYGPDPVGPDHWREALDHARLAHEAERADKRKRAEDFLLGGVARPGRALVGWVRAGVGDADDTYAGRAQVRDSRESLEVLVVQRRADGTLATLPWLRRDGGRELPAHAVPPTALARTVASCGMRLPYEMCADPRTLDRVIEELEAQCVEAWQAKEAHWLAGELVLALDQDQRAHLAGFDLHYTRSDGLKVSHGD